MLQDRAAWSIGDSVLMIGEPDERSDKPSKAPLADIYERGAMAEATVLRLRRIGDYGAYSPGMRNVLC